jgi:integrase
MGYAKGEQIERGIWRRTSRRGYVVEVSVRDAETGGRIRKTKSLPRLDFAREWRDRTKADGILGEIRKSKRITYSEFAEEYLAWWGPRRRPSFVKAETAKIRKGFIPAFGDRQLSSLSRRDIEGYLAKRQSGLVGPWQGRTLTPASMNREICRFKNMLGKAVEWGYIEVNPAEGVKQEREYVREADFLDRDEIRCLLAVSDGNLFLMVLCAIYTGLRWGEQMKLQWRDVDFKRGLLTIRDTKNHETRHVPMNGILAEAMQRHRTAQARGEGGIRTCAFVNPATGEPYTDLRKRFRAALKRAGIERHFTWHGLRHTAASQLVMAGVDLRTVGKILGHKSYAMTLRYAHLSPGHLKEATERLGEHLAFGDGDFMETSSQNAENRPKGGSGRGVKTAS